MLALSISPADGERRAGMSPAAARGRLPLTGLVSAGAVAGFTGGLLGLGGGLLGQRNLAPVPRPGPWNACDGTRSFGGMAALAAQ